MWCFHSFCHLLAMVLGQDGQAKNPESSLFVLALKVRGCFTILPWPMFQGFLRGSDKLDPRLAPRDWGTVRVHFGQTRQQESFKHWPRKHHQPLGCFSRRHQVAPTPHEKKLTTPSKKHLQGGVLCTSLQGMRKIGLHNSLRVLPNPCRLSVDSKSTVKPPPKLVKSVGVLCAPPL